MNIGLTPHLEEMIREKIAWGSYTSASDVVREAFRLLEQEDQLRALKLERLRQDVLAGLDSGPSIVFDRREIERLPHGKKPGRSGKYVAQLRISPRATEDPIAITSSATLQE